MGRLRPSASIGSQRAPQARAVGAPLAARGHGARRVRGVQRTHDRYDAEQLARLHHAGELTPVRVPAAAEERGNDLVRLRMTL